MDVLKVLKDMQDRFYREFGDVHKREFSQHEKHLTWMQSYYYTDEDENQINRNKSFVLGYRIGLKEQEHSYDRGYESGIEEMKCKFKELIT